MMSTRNERTPLLPDPTSESDTGSVNFSTTEEDDELVDDSIDLLLSRLDSHGTTLGHIGGLSTFGTSFSVRRCSLSFEDWSISRVPTRAGRHSTSSFTDAQETRDIRPSCSPVSVLHEPRKVSDYPADEYGGVEEVEDVPASARDPIEIRPISAARFWSCFAGIVLTGFVGMIDSTLMASSHPVITSYFNAANSASWLSTSFLLATTAFQPLFGRVSDTFGRRGPLLFCLSVFLLGTAWCSLAQTIVQFIFARAACGLGAGGALALGSIVNSDLVPLERRGSYLSLLNLAYGAGSSSGAALGGILADSLGWRWEFAIQLPAIFLCLMAAWLTVPSDLGPNLALHSNQTLRQSISSFDLAGSLLLTLTVSLLVLALNFGGNILPWSSPIIICSIVASVSFGTILVFIEHRTPKPVLRLHFFTKIPAAGRLILSNFFTSMTMNCILFNLPLYFQSVLSDTPSRSGTRLIIPFIGNMVAAFLTGNFITWSKRLYPTLVVGYSLIILGAILLTLMSSSLPTWAYSWLIATATLGQGFSFPTVSISVLAVTSAEDMAVAMSTLILFRNLGTVMGVAVSSLISQNVLLHYLNQIVTGHDKAAVIEAVRKSVEAIAVINPKNRKQVRCAYAAALRITFAQGVVTAVIALLLVLLVKLPRLKTQPATITDE